VLYSHSLQMFGRRSSSKANAAAELAEAAPLHSSTHSTGHTQDPQQQQHSQDIETLLRKKSLSPFEVAAVREGILKQKTNERAARVQQAFQKPAVDADTMSVGPGIVAKGDVEGCAKLLVQGHFEGNFEGQHLLVAAGGRYSGTAICATAQIDGLFEGQLQADRLLTVSSSGRIQGGSIRFGRLDQQDGGIVSGDVEELDLLSDDGT
jgi:cytoskeletal protein CcmA (bactofilin family)